MNCSISADIRTSSVQSSVSPAPVQRWLNLCPALGTPALPVAAASKQQLESVEHFRRMQTSGTIAGSPKRTKKKKRNGDGRNDNGKHLYWQRPTLSHKRATREIDS